MQFKHPEILWALLLLLIPIFIHLFQLRRFKRTPFTNVAMLQKVVSESRKSNQLKKWLLLITRLLLVAALVIAFAQPFSASQTATTTKETVIYLDNSFSMQAKDNGLSILEQAVQDLIKNIGEDNVFTLFTNGITFRKVTVNEIKNELLSLQYTHEQLDVDAITLRANSLFSNSENTIKQLVLISDFQQNMDLASAMQDSSIQTYLVPVRSSLNRNVSIDSISLEEHPADQSKLTVLLSGGINEESLPISLHNGGQLIAKTSANFAANGNAKVELSIPVDTEILGTLSIQDNALSFDNQFYFNIDEKEQIRVLAISESDNNYLQRLFPDEEFQLQLFGLNQLDYSALGDQHVVVLNELKSIPNGLQQVLRSFKENGGTVILVPAVDCDLNTYNPLLSNFYTTKFLETQVLEKKITGISFDHPLYRNVFNKRVQNFQYPRVNQSYQLVTQAPTLLAFESGDPFLCGIDGFYFFTAALNLENSNFKNSPLIVPTFYNMAAFSLKAPAIQHTLGQPNRMDIATELGNDNILKVAKTDYEFIPRQQSFTNRVQLDFDENPSEDGVFEIQKSEEVIKRVSFNYPRTESLLIYTEVEESERVSIQDSVTGLFEHLKASNTITSYWKWFVILALFLALLEVLIQKFIK